MIVKQLYLRHSALIQPSRAMASWAKSVDPKKTAMVLIEFQNELLNVFSRIVNPIIDTKSPLKVQSGKNACSVRSRIV